MSIATVTSKGQITIPKRIREEVGLRTGDRLDFRLQEDGTIRVRPIAKTVSEVFGAFADKARRPLSAGQIKKRLAEAFEDREL